MAALGPGNKNALRAILAPHVSNSTLEVIRKDNDCDKTERLFPPFIQQRKRDAVSQTCSIPTFVLVTLLARGVHL